MNKKNDLLGCGFKNLIMATFFKLFKRPLLTPFVYSSRQFVQVPLRNSVKINSKLYNLQVNCSSVNLIHFCQLF